MPVIDLIRLRRESPQRASGALPACEALWDGTGLKLAGNVRACVSASLLPGGDVAVSGSWSARFSRPCDRCLDEMRVSYSESFSARFSPGASQGTDADDDIYPIPTGSAALDLTSAIREEVIAGVPRYLLPPLDDEGNCAECGPRAQGLRRGSGGRRERLPDPRWAPLAALSSANQPLNEDER